MNQKITIAIDAGHGGKDPGAIGHRGLQEKTVNLAIANELKKLLNNDKMFRTILTRKNDSYISVNKRREFIQKHRIHLLVSIHANSSKKKGVSGASLWIISNNRMNREISNYLKKNQSSNLLCNNLQNIFNANKNDLFLKKTILDLQFNNLKKIELDLSKHLSEELNKQIKTKKIDLNYASLGILSCIHIPSILIETGFITNLVEEKKLSTTAYQKKIARAIYIALKNYFINQWKLNKKKFN
ncbi:N-acetylmuramoyl-L-alanine amidase [Buchnera aphidicola (Hyadaphis tataricae)]|uniref:N-acetylmuramoyl-L-alanine amidase n=1 Tax=Buchnera aphidicola (Hyadaphis tataricae) TaxID=1241859 RepID=A0A4D6Y6C6_9GAMM|nr:N-acetylmuramoyl-L-alanine amidase [Buchnera aphidicola]QCI21894.1 N-acetylmuramoyl-L-alanine amidase [Buchnera aphidicola (Hyadaphis tataricae)]